MKARGIESAPGSQSCFLNVLVQVMWNVASFRSGIAAIRDHSCGDGGNAFNCVVCQLKGVLAAYAGREPCSSDDLREWLAASSRGEFPLNTKCDPTEAMAMIMARLHTTLPCTLPSPSSSFCLSHKLLGCTLRQEAKCPRRCAASDPVKFDELTFSVTLYVENFASYDRAKASGRNRLEDAIFRSFNEDIAKPAPCTRCGTKPFTAKHTAGLSPPSSKRCISCSGLTGLSVRSSGSQSCSRCHGAITKTTILSSDPDVLQVVVVSPHDNPSASLPSLLEAISASIRLTAVVDVAERVTSSVKHHLRGMVCFTSNHYIALFPTTEGRWVYCDDNTTKLFNSWGVVQRKCISGHILPVMLFFERALPHLAQEDTKDFETIRRDFLASCGDIRPFSHSSSPSSDTNTQSPSQTRSSSKSPSKLGFIREDDASTASESESRDRNVAIRGGAGGGDSNPMELTPLPPPAPKLSPGATRRGPVVGDRSVIVASPPGPPRLSPPPQQSTFSAKQTVSETDDELFARRMHDALNSSLAPETVERVVVGRSFSSPRQRQGSLLSSSPQVQETASRVGKHVEKDDEELALRFHKIYNGKESAETVTKVVKRENSAPLQPRGSHYPSSPTVTQRYDVTTCKHNGGKALYDATCPVCTARGLPLGAYQAVSLTPERRDVTVTATLRLRCSRCSSSHTVDAVSGLCSFCARSRPAVSSVVCPNCYQPYTVPHDCSVAGKVLRNERAQLGQCSHCKLWFDYPYSHESTCVMKMRASHASSEGSPSGRSFTPGRFHRPTSSTVTSSYFHTMTTTPRYSSWQ